MFQDVRRIANGRLLCQLDAVQRIGERVVLFLVLSGLLPRQSELDGEVLLFQVERLDLGRGLVPAMVRRGSVWFALVTLRLAAISRGGGAGAAT